MKNLIKKKVCLWKMLDRVDSYLFTPAVVFYAVTLVLPLVR